MSAYLTLWRRCSLSTRLSLAAVLLTPFNPWIGLIIAWAAVWSTSAKVSASLSQFRFFWFFAPVLIAFLFIGHGESTPTDDLMRHLSAWQLGFDYRSQYPWSTLPAIDPWLGFDWLISLPQRAGVSKAVLLQWIPGFCLLLQSVVLYGLLKRVLPAHRHSTELFLLAGALGMLCLTPRSLLGRPEMFLLIFGMGAGLTVTRRQALLWGLGFLALVPTYWLGWVYAPFALLLAPAVIPLKARLTAAAALFCIHVGAWQMYTGDYLGLLRWLQGTLSVLANENAPMATSLSYWFAWVLLAGIAFALSTLNRRRMMASLPVLALIVWFCAPNQLRYFSAVAACSLPWIYRCVAVLAHARRVSIPPVVALMALSIAAALSIQRTEETPKFQLSSSARVYSESPYATVYFGQPGIAVEPSFALGATKPEWKALRTGATLHCEVLQRGKFTHVVEKSLVNPLPCGELSAVQGPWRLWRLK